MQKAAQGVAMIGTDVSQDRVDTQDSVLEPNKGDQSHDDEDHGNCT